MTTPIGIADSRNRRTFIGGSDARVIMGTDEAALLRMWREKRGEAEPEDLSDNLIVQLGLVTEPLNRHWFERNTGQTVECLQHRLRPRVICPRCAEGYERQDRHLDSAGLPWLR